MIVRGNIEIVDDTSGQQVLLVRAEAPTVDELFKKLADIASPAERLLARPAEPTS